MFLGMDVRENKRFWSSFYPYALHAKAELKSVFSEIRVRTWVQVFSHQRNRPLVDRPDRSANQRVFLGRIALELRSWLGSQKKTDFTCHHFFDEEHSYMYVVTNFWVFDIIASIIHYLTKRRKKNLFVEQTLMMMKTFCNSPINTMLICLYSILQHVHKK